MKKLERIETTHYVLWVSDEQIKDVRLFKDKYHLEKGHIINKFPTYLTDLSECKLIIAYQPKGNVKELDLPLLPEINTPKYRVGRKQKRAVLDEQGHEVVIFPAGKEKETQEYCDFLNSKEIVVEDDVEKLAEKYANLKNSIHDYDEQYYNSHGVSIAKGFIEGYKSANKSYSEEDLRKSLSEVFKASQEGYNITTDEIIQSLKQPKTPKWFVAEYKTEYTEDGLDYQSDELKTLKTNGKTYLVGKYLTE
jgi:hypothetical protein